MFPKTPVAGATRKQAFRDENALLPGKSMLQNSGSNSSKQFMTPTQQTSQTRRVPLGGKDTNVHGIQAQKGPQQQPQKSFNAPLSERRSSGARSSMRASARKRLQVRTDNAAPLAETKHVGLPQHLWKSTEIETMPPKEEPVDEVFEEWTFDNEDILGEGDVCAPAQSRRNSLDLDWDALDVFDPLPEVPSTTPKRVVKMVPKEAAVPKPFPTMSFTGKPSKPIAKPFSRRPNRVLQKQNPDKENEVRTPLRPAPVRTSTPSKIPIKTSTPKLTTPLRASKHSFMNPTKSAEAKMKVRVDSPNVKASPVASRGRVSRMASCDTLRPSTGGSEENRPTTADSNWSNISDLDRFSFEEDFE